MKRILWQVVLLLLLVFPASAQKTVNTNGNQTIWDIKTFKSPIVQQAPPTVTNEVARLFELGETNAALEAKISASGANPTGSGGALTNISQGNVSLVKPNGLVTNGFASTDALRGALLSNAVVRGESGDVVRAIAGSFYLNNNIDRPGLKYDFALGTSLLFTNIQASATFDVTNHHFELAGNGSFLTTNDSVTTTRFTGSNNTFVIEAQRVRSQGVGAAALIIGGTGTVQVVESIISDQYDGVWVASGNQVSVYCPFIRGATNNANGNALELVGTDAISVMSIFSDKLSSFGTVIIAAIGKSYVRANQIVALATNGNASAVDVTSQGHLVIDSAEIYGTLFVRDGTTLHLKDCRVISTNNVATSAINLQTNSNLILENCVIIAPTNFFSVARSGTPVAPYRYVQVIGSLQMSVPASSNIIFFSTNINMTVGAWTNTGPFSLGTAPTQPPHAVNKAYVDAAIGNVTVGAGTTNFLTVSNLSVQYFYFTTTNPVAGQTNVQVWVRYVDQNNTVVMSNLVAGGTVYKQPTNNAPGYTPTDPDEILRQRDALITGTRTIETNWNVGQWYTNSTEMGFTNKSAQVFAQVAVIGGLTGIGQMRFMSTDPTGATTNHLCLTLIASGVAGISNSINWVSPIIGISNRFMFTDLSTAGAAAGLIKSTTSEEHVINGIRY